MMLQPGSVNAVCKHWLRGYCRQGTTCVFRHEQEGDGSMMTMLENIAQAQQSNAALQAQRLYGKEGKGAVKEKQKKKAVVPTPKTVDPPEGEDFIEDFVDQLVSGSQTQYRQSQDTGTKRGSSFRDPFVPLEKRIKRLDAVPSADEYQAQDKSGAESWDRSKSSYAGNEGINYPPGNSRVTPGRPQNFPPFARTEYPVRDQMQTMGRSEYAPTYKVNQSAFRKASQSISNLMYGGGDDSQTYPSTSQEVYNPSDNRVESSMPGHAVTDRTPYQSSQTQHNTLAEKIESSRLERWNRPVHDQMGYSEYGSNVYMDANSQRTGGTEKRQMAHVNRSEQYGGSTSTSKFKNVNTDEKLGVMSQKKLDYGNVMQMGYSEYGSSVHMDADANPKKTGGMERRQMPHVNTSNQDGGSTSTSKFKNAKMDEKLGVMSQRKLDYGNVMQMGYSEYGSNVHADANPQKTGGIERRQMPHVNTSNQMGYSEYGSNVYMDANSQRTGGIERRQMAHVNRSEQGEGSTSTSKFKNAKTDEELGILPPRRINYGNEMLNFIVGYMKNAGQYKVGVQAVVKAYKLPANCVGLTPPKMNTEAWDLLTKKAQTRDEMLQDLQRWFASGLIPLVQQLAFFGTGSQIIQDVCRYTSDSLNVMAFVCSILSIKRRLLMRNSLHSKFSLLCRRKQPVSELLFGDKLSIDLQAVKAGTFKISEAEKHSLDPNNDDPEGKDFKPTFFACLALPEGEVDESVANIINMACANDGDVSDLREKYKIPANLKTMAPPKINAEIWNLVSRSGLELDYRLQDVHLSISEAMVPLMLMMQSVHEKKYSESEVLQLLTDAVLLFGNSMYQLNKVRMNAMRRSLPDHAQGSCGFFWPGANHVSLEALSELSQMLS